MLGVKSVEKLKQEFEPQADYGFFGPDSVTWKVWSHPTSYILGFVRSVTIEHLDPNLAAAVITAGGVKYRPHTRYARTLNYFGQVAFGASEPTARAADILVKIHSKAIGHDPVTGGEYDANNPSSQLWIHVTAWHSILYCYEKFGPGPLSPEEEDQYWAECARAAELQTIEPGTVPRNREEVRKYFEDWRPHLAISEGAKDMVDFILTIDVALPPSTPGWQRKLLAPVIKLLRMAVISTYPKYMRDYFGLRQSGLIDRIIRPIVRAGHQALARSVPAIFAFGQFVAPSAFPVLAPVLLEIPPVEPVVRTPRETQAKLGLDIPSEAHKDIRARQRKRVFDEHTAPSDEGLFESEGAIGAMNSVIATKAG